MEKSETKLIITALAPEPVYHHGKTGGDVRLAEIFRRFSQTNGLKIFVVSTPYNWKYFGNNGIKADFRMVGSRFRFRSLAGLCLKSMLTILKSFFVLRHDFLKGGSKKIIIYSSSDLFWEVIPAFFYKTRNKNIKWVQVIHHIYPDWKTRPGNKIINFFGYYLQRFSLWLIRKRADRIILVSESVRKDLLRLGFAENKIAVSSNGIDHDNFERIKKIGFSYDGVFLARLSYSKGILDLIEIWKNVCRELPQAKLAVIGGGNEKTKKFLAKKISNYSLEKNVDLLGFLNDEKAYSILKSGKVFLFPSHEEGWGIAIAEAMACGLPVVSWNLPVYKEIFEKYIVQIEENNVNLFSGNILDLLKNDAKRKEVGDQGKEFIKKYSWDNVAKKEREIIFS